MKSFMKTILAIIVVLMMCGSAMAETDFNAKGSIIVPNIWTYNTSSSSWVFSYINLSNITGTDVQCKVTVYDNDGNDVTHFSKVYTSGQSIYTEVSSGTGEFDIPAHASRIYSIKGSQPISGYAVVEWKSSDPKLRKALLAGMTMLYNYGGVSVGICELNNGQPF